MTPKVGDMVWYVPQLSDLDKVVSAPPWPATITQVYTDTDVDLHIYPPNGRILETPHAHRGQAPGQWRQRRA